MITIESLKELFMEAGEEFGDDGIITSLVFQEGSIMLTVDSKQYGNCSMMFAANDLVEEKEKPKLTLVKG
jgi:hypothetical protein